MLILLRWMQAAAGTGQADQHVKPYGGVVVLTDTSAFPINASDHNGVFAGVSFTQQLIVPVPVVQSVVAEPVSMPVTPS
jgi:hypothetical protein